MSYTTTEIEAAVAKIVRTTIRRQYGALGNRRTDLQFNDTKDAAAGVFILFNNAPFYVVKLAASSLDAALVSEQDLITNFIETVRATGRDVRPVNNLSPLNNARVALAALSVATAARDNALETIEDVSAFKRFEDNTQRFLDDNKGALISGGVVVQTPSQARAQLGNLFSQLEAAHVDVIRRVRALETAIDDFNALQLPNLLSQSIIENSKDVLEQRIEQLEALTPQARLDVLRAVTLDILAARASVRGFGSITAPTTFLILDGNGAAFTDSTHLATPAKLASDLYGPYTVVNDLPANGGGVALDFTLDGDTSVTMTIQLQGSFIARIEGVTKGPYDIGDPNSVSLKTDLTVLGMTNFTSPGSIDLFAVLLTTDFTKESYELAKEINAAKSLSAPTLPMYAEPYANPLQFTGGVDISLTATVGTDADLIAQPSGAVDFGLAGLDIQPGDWVRVTDPTSANFGTGDEAFGAIFEVESIFTTNTTDDSLAVIQKTALGLVEEISTLIPLVVPKVIEISSGTMPFRLRISDKATEPGGDTRVKAVDNRYGIFLPEDDTALGQTKDDQFNGLTTIGLFPLQEAVSRPTTARDVAKGVSQNFAASIGQDVRVSAEAVFDPTIATVFGRTDPFNFLRAILYKQRDFDTSFTVDVDVATFTLSTDVLDTVVVGDIIVMRTHLDATQIGNWGIITSVSGAKVVATMISAPVADTGREVEIGPNVKSAPIGTVPFDPTLRVATGTLNDGDYGVLSISRLAPSPIPIELDLDRTFPFSVGAGNLPVELGVVQLGQFRVDYSSTDETLTTAITIDDTNLKTIVARFFNNPTQSDVGETIFFVLPEFPKNLEEGDILELYTTQFNSPSFSSPISGLESLRNLIELETELPTDTGSFVFDADSQLPFARIRKLNLNNYSTLNTNLNSWLGLDSSGSLFFPNLQRLLNPLAVNTNPTLFQVNDPINELTELATDLDTLSGYLSGYEATTVEQVDTLIDTFLEKGADRAVTLLLEAQFSTFFGLDIDELSFSGTLQKAIRETEREDLPVRKTKRLNDNAALDTLIAEYEEPDFEFDKSDVEDFADVDIPVGSQGVPFPGQSF